MSQKIYPVLGRLLIVNVCKPVSPSIMGHFSKLRTFLDSSRDVDFKTHQDFEN